MAYTSIDDPTQFFNTILYTGNDADNRGITGVNFAPNWVWIKKRNNAAGGVISDTVRGAGNVLYPSETNAEGSESASFVSFDSDGYTISQDAGVGLNVNSHTYVGWNWKAGGSAPAITYVVKVVSDSGNKYRFDDFGTSAVTLDLQEGGTYTFDQSDSSNSGHPLRFYTASDKSGGEYTTGVTTSGTAGNSGAKTVITVAASAPTLYYQCSNHAGMGGQANTNSLFGSSNFSGSIQTLVSANNTAGFSIVSYTGTGSNATIGHGLGVTPAWILIKGTSFNEHWQVYHKSLGATKFIEFSNSNSSTTNSNRFNDTEPTSSVFTIGTKDAVSKSSATLIAYCFAEKKGYSKFGSYSGNSNADGVFIYTGFKPRWFLCKSSNAAEGWNIWDSKRSSTGNPLNEILQTDSGAEFTSTDWNIDFVSNGIKMRGSDGGFNYSGYNYIFMAFAESPFTNSNGVPTNAE